MRFDRLLRNLVLLCSFFLLLSHVAAAQTRLLRFPDIHEDKVVFTYGGDLWVAASSGGLARRLTAHPGVEYFAKFSPDGKWIAFTGQYDGDEQVYVIPAEGGVPKQLTSGCKTFASLLVSGIWSDYRTKQHHRRGRAPARDIRAHRRLSAVPSWPSIQTELHPRWF